jgi:glycosyltransferase involved in cell wall biosynthesis
MSVRILVTISTHNPHVGRLRRTLDGLRAQTLPHEQWDFVLVDNASADPALCRGFDLGWHPRGRLVREERLGLTYGRLAGLAASDAPLVLFVDDDNVLIPSFVEDVANLFDQHPKVGALGGKVIPEYEVEPEPWVQEFAGCLALRDLGDEPGISVPKTPRTYPDYAPVGAGMAVRRAAIAPWVEVHADPNHTAVTGRCGKNLTSGEDNDIILTILGAGWEVGYFPQLRLAHLIPSGRLTRDYVARLNHAIARSWVQVLALHGIRPWTPVAPWTVRLRKWRAYWSYRAWRDAASYVRWRGACGNFEGRAALAH